MPDDRHRPSFHFTPPAYWMNDPNGLVYHAGEYHLFYQHNPYGTEWGHMSWGHAVSQDLVRWEHLPIAIWERPEAGYTAFSGSAVVDREDTTGQAEGAEPPLVAVFTADHRTQDPRVQNIHVAFSLDRGRTFREAEENPVLSVGEAKFGDPKVFWHASTGKWLMASISGLGQGHVVFYGSRDLLSWEKLSEFHEDREAPGVWECPDLFPMALDGDPDDVRWVLKTNCVSFGGGPSGTRFFVGDFDGETFSGAVPIGENLTSDDGAVYAEVTYNGLPDGRRVLIGWLRQQPCHSRPWTGVQSVPRELTLRSDGGTSVLCHEPVRELASLRGQRRIVRDRPLGEEIALDEVALGDAALDIRLVLDLRHATGGGVSLRLAGGETVRIGVSVATRELYVARDGADRVATGCDVDPGAAELRVLLDHEIIEAFAGETAGVTALLPFGSSYDALSVFGAGVAPHMVRADVWAMARA